MINRRRSAVLVALSLMVVAMLASAAVACGGNDSPDTNQFMSGESGPEGPAGPAGSSGAAMATATAGAPAPTPSLPGRDVNDLLPDSGYGITAEYWDRLLEAGGDEERAAELAQIQGEFDKLAEDADAQHVVDLRVANAADERIIVRTVDMDIEVTDVSAALSEIGSIATNLGGWVVSSNQQQARDGFISIRVPAQSLDAALSQVRDVAAAINSEVVTSQDFTEEFTDTAARIDTLSRTLDSLRALFERADTVEEAISVQAEITKVQADLEALQARLDFLQQSSAYSLVKIELTAKPFELAVDGGPDLVIAEGRPHNFQARFSPPDGIEDYVATWNFGDGSNERITDRVAPTTVEGELITSPVGHVFASEDSSPFIVTVEIRGTGPGGVVEGRDTLVATVQRIPAIEVFAGENLSVDEGREVKFRGSFTRPEGIENLRAEWNFGDGSAPVTIELNDGTTVVETAHVYDNYRPTPYPVTLKVVGNSPAGLAEGVDQLSVQVRQPEGVTASGFDAGSTSRSAVQALANIGAALASFAIWAAILSPVWIFALAAVYFSRRRMTRTRS